MTEEARFALSRIASLMRGLTPACDAGTSSYDVLSDALIWEDELPVFHELVKIKNWSIIRIVFHYRTKCILSQPIEEYEQEFWDEAQRLFPDWPGFAPDRRSPDLGNTYRKLSACHRWELHKIEREVHGELEGQSSHAE